MPVFESTPAGIRALPPPNPVGYAAGIDLRLECMDRTSLGTPPQAPADEGCPLMRRLSQESRANLLRCFLPDRPEASAG